MVRAASAVVVFGFAVLTAGGQDKAKKPLLPDTIPGYKVQMIHGFTVAVHDDVRTADVKKFTRKPLEAVELDLKAMCGLFNDKGVEKLRAIPLWVDWDKKTGLNNGREGEGFTQYFGNSAAALTAAGDNPLKAGGVGVLRAKALTEVYQTTDRAAYLQLIHPYLRAFQGQYLAGDAAAIRTAYRTAVAHKLYDKTGYCTTEERAFFADLSTAYLDFLYYFPHGRGDLQKHDPATYKLLDGVWAKYLAPAKVRAAGTKPPDGAKEYRFDFKPADINLGPHLVGGKFDPKATADTVVLFAYWQSDEGVPLKWLKRWHEELEPFGFQVVLFSADYTREKDDVVRRLETRGVSFPTFGLTYTPGKIGGQNWAYPSGHVAVFAADGKCTYRGPLADGEAYVREAVGRKILKDADLPDVAKAVQPAVTALTAGEPIPAVIAKLQPATTESTTTTRDQARKLMDILAKPVEKRLATAASLEKSDPYEAYRIAEATAAEYKGTPFAAKAEKLTSTLKIEKTVAAELKARKELDAVMKIEADLNVQPGSFSPKDPAFQKANAAKLKELKAAVDRMRKNHPKAKATEEAEAVGKEFVD